MAIYKNFPSVSKLVSEGIFDADSANLLYKINRSRPDPKTMVKMIEGSNPRAASRLDNFIRCMHSPTTRRRAFRELCEILGDGYCGVLYMGEHKRNHYDIYILNAGDLYSITLAFYEHHDGTVRITSQDEVREVLA